MMLLLKISLSIIVNVALVFLTSKEKAISNVNYWSTDFSPNSEPCLSKRTADEQIVTSSEWLENETTRINNCPAKDVTREHGVSLINGAPVKKRNK